MKVFFIALILGIFIGALSMSYFKNPDTFYQTQDTEISTENVETANSESAEDASSNIAPPASPAIPTPTEAEKEEVTKEVEAVATEIEDAISVPEIQSDPIPDNSIAAMLEKAKAETTEDTPEDKAPIEEIKQEVDDAANLETPSLESAENTPMMVPPATIDEPTPSPEEAAEEPAVEAEAVNDRRQDLLIGSKVQSALLLDESLADMQLTAQVSSGKVTLQGEAPDEETKQRAISTVAKIPLVNEVIDNIELEAPAPE